jgi:outer membrane receptor protein involved in Fe transport
MLALLPVPGPVLVPSGPGGSPGRRIGPRAAATLAAMAALFAVPTLARAQRVTGAIDGTILKDGAIQGAAAVEVTDLTTGTVIKATANARGGYALTGLAPGAYLLTVRLASGEEAAEYVQVGVGQSLRVDVEVGTASVRGGETIEVSGRLADTTTSEVAVDVDRAQIDNLPQNSRNFLNFAQLAPGVRLSSDELNQNVSSGGMPARQVNVFVDGVSLKNNVIEGGVAGQDASRGNPFPQLAIGGFRVLTQNFKAEYEQAGSSIISTVTRSGGNDPHVELYASYQDRNITAIDPFVEKLDQPRPRYLRYQAGGLVSGPIIENKLFALATYEGNYQDRQNLVTLGDPTADNLARFGQYQGAFTSPFREHLGFSKITWLPDPAHTVDVSAFLRRESDIRSFGGVIAREAAENIRNNVLTVSARHQWRRASGLVNEATVQFLDSQFNPGAENPDVVGQDYTGVIRIGGRDTDQDVRQRAFTVRDDVSLPGFDAGGEHRVKVGGKVSLQRYRVERTQFGNPVFRYRIDPANGLDYDAPFEAQYGIGDPRATSSNTQLGLFAQDDWQVTRRLELNLGVRWDIETNPLNNDHETPADVRAAVTELATTVAEVNGPDFFEVDSYLTDGTERPIFLGAVQPRVGASYDLSGDQHTVLFAGAGRYFDRTLFNTGVDERLRLQYGVRTFRFSGDGAPRDGQPTIPWDPAYLSAAGLRALVDQGIAPNPEIFLLENDTEPVRSDQLSAGVRQRLGWFDLSATFSHIRSSHGVGFYPANRAATGNRDFLPVPGNFGNVLISADDIETRFTAVYVTAEKSYTDESRWGVSATYTLGWSKVRGDTFNFDFPSIEATPWTPGDNDERHRLVVGGIVGLPEDFRASTFVTLGTGLPYNISDASAGFGENFRFRRNGGRADGFLQYKQIDLRLTKALALPDGSRMSVFVECFNVLDWHNYGGYDGFIPPATEEPNPKLGQPTRLVGPTRSFQVGLTYGF